MRFNTEFENGRRTGFKITVSRSRRGAEDVIEKGYPGPVSVVGCVLGQVCYALGAILTIDQGGFSIHKAE